MEIGRSLRDEVMFKLARTIQQAGNAGQAVKDFRQYLAEFDPNVEEKERKRDRGTKKERQEARAEKAFEQVMETIDDLFSERGDEDKVWGSMVKQALKRRKPGFSESYHGFRSFGKLLEEMESRKMLTLEHDEKSGGYIITGVT